MCITGTKENVFVLIRWAHHCVMAKNKPHDYKQIAYQVITKLNKTIQILMNYLVPEIRTA